MKKIRSIPKYYKISWTALSPHQQSSHAIILKYFLLIYHYFIITLINLLLQLLYSYYLG